jgi:hypothetical protein
LKALTCCFGVALLAVFTANTAWAQAVASAQISGVVKDGSGGALPGADVRVTKTDTGLVRTAVTSADGSYVLPNLPIGPYQLKVSLQGFSTYVQDGIVLQVNTNPQINVTLAIGAVSEQVTVTANATMVETHSTGIGQVVDNQRVVELPLNGRQATELIFLAGLATSAPAGDLNTNKNYPTVTISVAGGQANGMTYIMDGATHNDPFNNLNLPTPFPDALQEFKVETSALPARYGHHAASAVNLVTKSGTNQYRGTGFGFVRHHVFNSKNYFAATKDSLKRGQVGGTLGGPITENRVFFFGGYQGTIERTNPETQFRYVPTQAMLNGDFTAFASPTCNGGRQISLRAPFANNRVNPVLFSPAAMAVTKYLPVATDPCGQVQMGIPDNNTEHLALAKIDYTINSRQSLLTRYYFARYDNPATYDGKNILTLSRTGQLNRAHSLVAGHNLILSSTAVNSFHVSFNKTFNDRTLPEYFGPADIGVKVFGPAPGYMGLNVSGNGFSVGSGATNPGYFNSTGFQLANDFDWIRGNHQFSFGANYIKTDIKTINNRPTNGAYTFNGSNIGLGLADFMLGRMSSFLQGNPALDNDDHDYFGAYLQDYWRVARNVSLNVGLRWEPYIPLRNTDSFVQHFEQAWFDGGIRSKVYPQAPVGMLFPGDDGYPGRATTHGKVANFAPRVGAIWSPYGDDRMSVRASWGIFLDTPHLFFNTRFSNSPPWGAQLTITNPPGGFDDPYLGYPGGNPFPALNTDWRTAPFPAFGVYVNTPYNMEPTALQQWNVSVQRMVSDWMLAASYLGNHGSHVWRAIELNPAVYGPGATTGNTNTRRRLYLQNSAEGRFYGTIGQLDDTGRSNYHGMLVSAQRRLRSGWSMLANYTLSRCMTDPATTELTGPTTVDPNNPDLDYAYCASDRRHIINLSAVARTPDFESGVKKTLLSGWQFSPIVRWQSGNRSTVTAGTDRSLTGVGGQRALRVLDDPYGDGTPEFYLNPAAFAVPDLGTLSTLKPFTIVNPSMLQTDFALTRTFRLRDESTILFRWEVFNFLNHVNFGAPTTALNSGNFGKILSAGDPRIMQFALKLGF